MVLKVNAMTDAVTDAANIPERVFSAWRANYRGFGSMYCLL
jgi:hypothetical protein